MLGREEKELDREWDREAVREGRGVGLKRSACYACESGIRERRRVFEKDKSWDGLLPATKVSLIKDPVRRESGAIFARREWMGW